jgi:hypothetical protein
LIHAATDIQDSRRERDVRDQAPRPLSHFDGRFVVCCAIELAKTDADTATRQWRADIKRLI